MSQRFLRCVKVQNNAFASSFVLKSEKSQQKHINYCSKHMVKMQWVVHKCLTGSIDLKRVEAKQRSCYWRFLILRVSYATSTLPIGKQLTRNSTWRPCDVCVNQFAKNDRKNGGMATGSCTTTVRPHTHTHTHFTSCAAVFGQTRHHSVAAAAILTRSRTV